MKMCVEAVLFHQSISSDKFEKVAFDARLPVTHALLPVLIVTCQSILTVYFQSVT